MTTNIESTPDETAEFRPIRSSETKTLVSPETAARHRVPKSEAPLRASTPVHLGAVLAILAVSGLLTLVSATAAIVFAAVALVGYVAVFVGSSLRAKRARPDSRDFPSA